ncbi:hypothetical protein BVRB_6g139170 [Beta vulgaris subsp. vulgaris]|nr:hypothetical protein BVRB_6g139170 [Beta vulgaris subsp. vulgaris]
MMTAVVKRPNLPKLIGQFNNTWNVLLQKIKYINQQ